MSLQTIVATVEDALHLKLEQPVCLPVGATVKLTVEVPDDPEREEWLRFSAQGLAAAYGDDEPEYTAADLKWVNPDCKFK